MIFSLPRIRAGFRCMCMSANIERIGPRLSNRGQTRSDRRALPPGGTSDIHARHVASKLGPALGASVIVENKPGASTILGTMAVVKAEPDGHTLLYTLTLTVAANPHLFSKLPYDPVRDLTPITYACNGTTCSRYRPVFP